MTGFNPQQDGGGPAAQEDRGPRAGLEDEKRYQLLLENTADIVVHTIDGVLQWVSPSIEALTGWTPADLTGSSTAHLWHPDDRPTAISQRDATYAGEPSRGTLRLQCKGGDYIWVDVALKPYVEPDGRVGAVGSLRDVSALMASKAQAERQSLLLQRVFDSMLEPHVLLTPVLGSGGEVIDFTVTAANAIAAQAFETSQEALLGRGLSSLLGTPTDTELTARLARWLTAGEPVAVDDWRSVSRTGVDRFFDIRASAAGSDLLVGWREVTDRHEAAARLKASEDAYRSLAENAADVILRLDSHDDVVWASPSTHRLLGYLPEDLRGPIPPNLFHPDDWGTFAAAVSTLRTAGSPVASRDVRLRHRHGSYVWWSVSARRTDDDPLTSEIVLALSNIDAKKQAELTIDREQARRVAALESMFDPYVLLQALTDAHGDIIDFRYIDANAAACTYMGMTTGELVGRTVIELLPAHGQTGLLSLYIETLRTGRPLALNDYEYPHEVLSEARRFDIRAVKVGDCLSFTWRDVTERNRAAQQLIKSEAQYRLLAEHIGDVIVKAGPTGVVEYVSPSLTSILGWRPDELIGTRLRELMHRDDADMGAAAVAALRAGKASFTGRGRLQHKDGSWRWIGTVTRVIRDEHGDITATISTWRDIQAEVEAGQRLAASERRFRLLAEHSLDIVATLTLDGRIEWISPSVEHVLGWSPEQMLGRTNSDFVHPLDREWFIADVRRVAQSGAAWRLTVRVLQSAGSYLWMESMGQITTDPDTGQAIRVVRLRDVEAAHRANEQLQRQQERLAETVNGVADPLMLLEPVWENGAVADFVVEEVNAAACRYLRHDHDELVGDRLLKHVPGLKKAGLFDQYVQALSSQEPLTIDDARVHSEHDGADRWFDNRATSSGGRLVVTWRDVTQRHVVAQALDEALARTRLLAENATDVVFRTDMAGVLEFCSDGAERLLDRAPGELIGTTLMDWVHPEDRAGLEGLFEHVGRIPAVRARLRRRDGSYVWVEFTTRGLADSSGGFAGLVGGWRDVSAEVAIQRTLQDQARIDNLTGLINRGEVFRRLETILSHPPRTGTRVAVAFADLDHLKDINDSRGHAAGDELIRVTAERLRTAVRNEDVVARIGGDELLIILPGVHSLAEAVTVVDTLRKIVGRPVDGGDPSVRSTVSFGVTLARPGDTSDEVIARADRGMYEAKSTGDRVVGVP